MAKNEHPFGSCRPARLGALALLGALAAGCNGTPPPVADPTASRPAVVALAAPAVQPVPSSSPSVVTTVRHFAALLAQGAYLKTPASRQFATSAPTDTLSLAAGTYLTWQLPAYEVVAFLDRTQRLAHADIGAIRVPDDPNRAVKHVPQPPAHLVRLGELRRAFGPEKTAPLMPGGIYFRYLPPSARQPVRIRAGYSAFSRTDTTWVTGVSVVPDQGD